MNIEARSAKMRPALTCNRVNIANANVYGLSKELGLVSDQYNIALVIFFVPYILFEVPSNLLLKRFSPHLWRAFTRTQLVMDHLLTFPVSFCMFMFGVVTICQGVVRSYSGLLATRFFLGFFESGMFPGNAIWILRYLIRVLKGSARMFLLALHMV